MNFDVKIVNLDKTQQGNLELAEAVKYVEQ